MELWKCDLLKATKNDDLAEIQTRDLSAQRYRLYHCASSLLFKFQSTVTTFFVHISRVKIKTQHRLKLLVKIYLASILLDFIFFCNNWLFLVLLMFFSIFFHLNTFADN